MQKDAKKIYVENPYTNCGDKKPRGPRPRI